MKNRLAIFILSCLSCFQWSQAQEITDVLEKEGITQVSAPVLSTFKATHISIGHSIETRKKGALELSFKSRYWNVPQESSNSFIADRMTARFGVDYALTDTFTIGIGVAAPSGVYDTFFKYRLLQQQADGTGSPLGITFFQRGTYRSRSVSPGLQESTASDDFVSKMGFTSQLLIARKINSNFSLQISPTYIHRGYGANGIDDRNHFAVGFGGRYKVSNHVSLVSEYYYLANTLNTVETFGAFSLGANWEVGKIMLQFKMTNNQFFAEDIFITQTRKNFNFRDGNFFFGFQGTYYIQL